jgi:hypothetical protein
MSTLRSGSIRSDLLGKQLLFQNPPKKWFIKKKKSYSDSSCAWTSDRIDCSQPAKTNLNVRGWYIGMLVCIYGALGETVRGKLQCTSHDPYLPSSVMVGPTRLL